MRRFTRMSFLLALLPLVMLTLAACAPAGTSEPADLVLVNALVHTLAWPDPAPDGGWRARAPDGTLRTHKLLSVNPEHYADAATEGIRRLLELAPGAPIPTPLH